MKAIQVLVLLLVCLPGVGRADVVRVGGVSIEVPTPAGFAKLTPEMAAVYEMQQHFIPPTNIQYAAYIPEAAVPEAITGELAEFDRWLVVQTAKSIADKSISRAQFGQLRTTIRANNEKLFAEAQRLMPGLTAQVSAEVSQQLGLKWDLGLGGMVPLPPHQEDERSMALSMFMRNEHTVDGEMFTDVVAATFALVHVENRVLFLYVYGGKDDLEWTRQVAGNWVKQVLASNGPGAPAARNPGGSLGSNASGTIDWGKVVTRGLGAALAVWLLTWMVKRG